MKSGFLDKLIARIGRLEPEEVQNALVRLVQEKGFLEKIFESLKEGVIVIDVDGQVTVTVEPAPDICCTICCITVQNACMELGSIVTDKLIL